MSVHNCQDCVTVLTDIYNAFYYIFAHKFTAFISFCYHSLWRFSLFVDLVLILLSLVCCSHLFQAIS